MVVWVEAHTTRKEQSGMTKLEKQVAIAHGKADELAKMGSETNRVIFAEQVAKDAQTFAPAFVCRTRGELSRVGQ